VVNGQPVLSNQLAIPKECDRITQVWLHNMLKNSWKLKLNAKSDTWHYMFYKAYFHILYLGVSLYTFSWDYLDLEPNQIRDFYFLELKNAVNKSANKKCSMLNTRTTFK